MSDDDDQEFDSMRRERDDSREESPEPMSSQPVHDVPATEAQEVDTHGEVESLSLLEPNQQGMITQAQLNIALKRAMEPLLWHVKKLKTQNDEVETKVTNILHKYDKLLKYVKELKGAMSKGNEDVGELLTGEGVQRLKLMCLRNLDMRANDENEKVLIKMFMEKAKKEGWLLKQSAKAEKDIVVHYREKRNYLKAQIRIRIHQDLINKTPAYSIKLQETIAFVTRHVGVPELEMYSLRILYNHAYILLKYRNKTVDTDNLSVDEKKIQKKAVDDVWSYTMERVAADRKAKRDDTVIKEKFGRLLENGATFLPC